MTNPANTMPLTQLKPMLWKAADKFRGSMDASQYREIVLGLIFLKYVTDSFTARQEELRAEGRADELGEEEILFDLNDQDAYLEKNIFWVAPNARWSYLQKTSKGLSATSSNEFKSIGKLIDEALEQRMKDNESLVGTLTTGFARESVDQRRLGRLVNLFSKTYFTAEGPERARDLLGEVYEYFLSSFARAEGKRGGEFYTPAPMVRTLVEILEPTEGHVYEDFMPRRAQTNANSVLVA